MRPLAQLVRAANRALNPSQRTRRLTTRMSETQDGWGAPNALVTGMLRANPGKLLVTCEHASADLPRGVAWGPADLARGLPSQHWASDPGALAFAEELAASLKAPLVNSLYSRLFVDVNRPVASPTIARTTADGKPVELNAGIAAGDGTELESRIIKHYLSYHRELERAATASQARTAVSVHTYTPNYEGSPRDFEVGVLFSTNNEALAHETQRALDAVGLSVRLNEPWSGKHGFMFSADNFVYNAAAPGTRDALMLEFRNDVCCQAEWRARVVGALVPVLLARPSS